MNNKRQIALNKLFNFCVIFGLLLLWFSMNFLIDGDTALAIGTGIAAFLFIILPAIFTPFCYLFDSDGVSFCYVFLPTEHYLWNDIYAIKKALAKTVTSSFCKCFFLKKSRL